MPSSETALASAEAFLDAAVNRLERSLLVGKPEHEEGRGAKAIVETVHLLMTVVVNYATDGWIGTPERLESFLGEAMKDSLQYIRRRGVQKKGCPTLDGAGDVVLGAASTMAHAMSHFLKHEGEPSEMHESLTATLVFGVLIRAFHQQSGASFSDFQKLLHRYFQDALDTYREELQVARPAGSAVH